MRHPALSEKYLPIQFMIKIVRSNNGPFMTSTDETRVSIRYAPEQGVSNPAPLRYAGQFDLRFKLHFVRFQRVSLKKAGSLPGSGFSEIT